MSVKAAKSIIYKLESTTQILSSYNSELYRAVWISASYGSDQWHLSGTTTAFGTEADTLLILWKLKAAGPPLDQIDAIMQKSVQQLGNHFTEHGAGFTGRSLPASKSRRSFNPQSRDSAAGSSRSTCCSASAQPLCWWDGQPGPASPPGCSDEKLRERPKALMKITTCKPAPWESGTRSS